MKYSQSVAVMALFLSAGKAVKINPAAPTGLQDAVKDQQYDMPLQPIKPLIRANNRNEDDFRTVYNPNKLGNPYLFDVWAQTGNQWEGGFSSGPNTQGQGNSAVPYSTVISNKGTVASQGSNGIVEGLKDSQYDLPHQPKKALLRENNKSEDDFRNVYNPNKLTERYAPLPALAQWEGGFSSGPNTQGQGNSAVPYSTVISNKGTVASQGSNGIVEGLKDSQYDLPHQPKKAIIRENNKSEDDFRNVYNPNKLTERYAPLPALSQIYPGQPTGLTEAEKDQQYDIPRQLYQPLAGQSSTHNENDINSFFNPNKLGNPSNFWAQSSTPGDASGIFKW